MVSPLQPVTLAGAPSKPAVVFLHGFMGDAEDWRPTAGELGAFHHVLAVNLPGHGPGWEAGTVREMGLAECAAGIVAEFDALGLSRPALAGYSMGGRVALYLAMHYPDRVSRLILESASPGLDLEEKRATREAQDCALARRLSEMDAGSEAFRTFLAEWYAMPLFASLRNNPALRDALMERRIARCTPRLLAPALEALSVGRQPNLWEELHAFKIPTLAIAGEEDRKYRIIAEDMALACPAIATEIFAGCGHNVHVENPGGFLTAVRAFLKPAEP